MKRVYLLLLVSIVLLTACGEIQSIATEAPTATVTTPTATSSPAPTSSPTEEPGFSIDALELTPDLAKALKTHAGLEDSIQLEANGTFSTNVTTLSVDGEPVIKSGVEVKPKTIVQDLTSKNNYGNTPVMLTVDGVKLYWIQEEKGWFALEISPDIHNPVFVPLEQLEVALRVVIAEFNQPFSQAALDRWSQNNNLMLGFQFINVNAKTGENTRFAYIQNSALMQPSLTDENRGVQVLDAWFTTTSSSGEIFEFFPTKWLDPEDAENPSGDEWKILFLASGNELMSDRANREKFEQILTSTPSDGFKMLIYPIIAADKNFFEGSTSLIRFGGGQPSLAKLLRLPGNTINRLRLPNRPGDTFDFWIQFLMDKISPEQTAMEFRFESNQDPTYKTHFFPPEFQLILYPSILILR